VKVNLSITRLINNIRIWKTPAVRHGCRGPIYKRYEAATAECTDRESLLRASVKRHIESQPHQPTQWVTPQSPVLPGYTCTQRIFDLRHQSSSITLLYSASNLNCSLTSTFLFRQRENWTNRHFWTEESLSWPCKAICSLSFCRLYVSWPQCRHFMNRLTPYEN